MCTEEQTKPSHLFILKYSLRIILISFLDKNIVFSISLFTSCHLLTCHLCNNNLIIQVTKSLPCQCSLRRLHVQPNFAQLVGDPVGMHDVRLSYCPEKSMLHLLIIAYCKTTFKQNGYVCWTRILGVTMCYVEVMRANLTQTEFSDSFYLLSCFYSVCLAYQLAQLFNTNRYATTKKKNYNFTWNHTLRSVLAIVFRKSTWSPTQVVTLSNNTGSY